MSMANMNQNALPMEASTTLTVCILIDGKKILLQALHNEDLVKGVLMGWMNMEPKSMQTLKENTFLATYAVGILAEEIGTAIETIDNWLRKPVVITCNEVTVAQLSHVLDHVQHNVGVELVVFNHRMDNLHSDSFQSVQSGHCSQVASPSVLGAIGPTILNKILGISCFLGTEGKRILFSSNSGTIPFQMLGKF